MYRRLGRQVDILISKNQAGAANICLKRHARHAYKYYPHEINQHTVQY